MSQKKRRIVPGVALVVLFAATGLLLPTAGGALAKGPPVVKVTKRLVNEPTTAPRSILACEVMCFGAVL